MWSSPPLETPKACKGGPCSYPFEGVDSQVYALAQGPIAVGGYVASGAAGGGVTKNHPTVATISKGAIIEREVPVRLEDKKELFLALYNSDFTTAEKVKESINRFAGADLARSLDSGTIRISIPEGHQSNPAEWIAAIEKLEVTPDAMAKVIVNERTGTIVMGENVRISTVAVAHGNLSIQIKENFNVSQPLPFAPGALPGASGRGVTPGAPYRKAGQGTDCRPRRSHGGHPRLGCLGQGGREEVDGRPPGG